MTNVLKDDLDHILAHTEGLWEGLRGQRIFVTGGTGFFGCWLLESFVWANAKLDLNAQAVVLSRNPQAFSLKAPHLFADKAITFHRGDVRDFQFPAGAFSHVIHAATEASAKLNQDNPLLMLDTIVEGTRHTLDFAVACGAQKFLLTSSGAVYGKQPPDMTHIPEDYAGGPDPLDPASAYGEGKRMAELLCAFYHRQHGIETKIARCFAFVGPYLPLDVHFAIGNFIRDALRGGPIKVKGDGTPYRSYLYAADLAIWLWVILFRGQPCRAYNVGSDEGLNIADLAKCVSRTLSSDVQLVIETTSLKDRRRQRYVPAVKRARHELQLHVWTPVTQAIHKTVECSEVRQAVIL
ncbi:MAG: NAD-dependent epimerase/dehydratase family protein [Kiritimatiellaeota bacterium]|nr:NAD-dependent epimerase/dehydratase family protein [Kiritimatiellota bacterium]